MFANIGRKEWYIMDFKKVAKQAVTSSPLMTGEALKTDEILNRKLTINAVDLIQLVNKKGEKQDVAVVTFKEIGNAYYLGGMGLTEIVKEWVHVWAKEHEGEIDRDAMNVEIAKENLVLVLKRTSTRNGNTFVLPTIE